MRHNLAAGEHGVFDYLEVLVEKFWPGALREKHLIDTAFFDADLPPEMDWNAGFREKVLAGDLEIPSAADEEEQLLLSLLLDQIAKGAFDPENLNFRWLGWKAPRHGFIEKRAEQHPEASFFFHLFVKD